MHNRTREDAIKAWFDIKKQEKALIAKRRKIEDFLTNAYADDQLMPEPGHSCTLQEAGCNVRIISRVNRKVNFHIMRKIAYENNVVEQANDLFRMSAEVNKAGWKTTSSEITDLFLPAITVTESRPSYSIEEIKNG